MAPRRKNTALWIGFAFLLLTIGSNVPALYASGIPEVILPWISLTLPVIGLIFCSIGLKRAISEPQIFRGKVGGWILTVVSTLLVALSGFGLFHARDLPGSSHAPQVGQKAPDFTLTDTGGQTVTLAQLLSSPLDTASNKAPKAVLLVFYRGYW